MDAAACAELLPALSTLGARVALAIRERVWGNDVRSKADGSPVTAADIAAEIAIRDGLADLAPTLPIVSEEQAEHPRPAGDGSYFLVDPLDGTREFIAGRNEYTINIALMTNGAPILGVIAAPALGLIWRGIVGGAAERVSFAADGTIASPNPIRTRLRPNEPIVLVSRSHLDARTQAYVASLPRSRTMPCGSAVKFCRIAEGSADLYPRMGPTHDWDVAAGHALIEAAGGRVMAPDGQPIRYGTPELLIPGFIASGGTDSPITGRG
jgi:3'(2'), 5'-bisphosphate nucleotidase